MNKLCIYNFQVKNFSNETFDLFIDGELVDAETEDIYKEFFNDNQKQAETQAEKILNKELILKNIRIAKEKIKSEIENLQNILY